MSNRLSKLSKTLRGSAILEIAGEVRAMIAQGHEILNLTVGDFSAAQFPIPKELENALVDAIRGGETTYPPPAGMDGLRGAVREYYRHRFGIDFTTDSILIQGGARPPIYATYRAL